MELKVPIKDGTGTKTKLRIVNCFINNLTEVELDIVAKMIDDNYIELNKNNRSQLRSSLNMNKYSFNNYIKYLKDKKVLYTKDNVLMLHPNIIKITADNKITIELFTKNG